MHHVMIVLAGVCASSVPDSDTFLLGLPDPGPSYSSTLFFYKLTIDKNAFP
jgi:hypothetical protein